jgi:hypothetical protein
MRQVSKFEELLHQPDDVYLPVELKITSLFPMKTIMKFPRNVHAVSNIKIVSGGNLKTIKFEINRVEINAVKDKNGFWKTKDGNSNLCDWFTLEKPLLLSKMTYSQECLIFESEDDSDIIISYNKIRFGIKEKFVPLNLCGNIPNAFELDHSDFKILYRDGFAGLYGPLPLEQSRTKKIKKFSYGEE